MNPKRNHMEDAVNKNHQRLGMGLLLALAFAGCQNKAAIQAIQELTTKMTDQVKTNHESLSSMTQELNACKTTLAEVQGVAAVVSELPALEIPSAPEKIDMASLEAYKQTLTDLVNKQDVSLTELKTNASACATELADAQAKKAEMEAAAAKKAEGNALFKEIEASQKHFAERAVKWELDTVVGRRMAYNHYFAKPAAAPKKG